jgi:hypothetical protein
MSRVLFGRVAGGLIAAATLCTVVVTAPGIAFANTAAESNVVLARKADTVFDVQTSISYWSIVAVRSKPGDDYDLAVTAPSTGQVAPSDLYGGDTDFVAIDTNRLPRGTYPANVYRFGGDGSQGYDFEFGNRAAIFKTTLYGQTTGSPGNSHDVVDYDPTVSRDGDVAKIFDVWLDAGQYYILKNEFMWRNDGNMFLLSSDPNNKNTWMQGRPAALRVHPGDINVHGGGCTLIRAARSGWYGMVVLFDDHEGGYHDWEMVDIEKAKSTDGPTCDKVGTF